MLREIALTPQVLDPSEFPNQDEWCDWALELLRHLVDADEKVFRCLVADLYDGSWQTTLNIDIVKELPQRLRARIGDLLHALDESSVRRPPCRDWPESEQDWVAEAYESSQQLPLARIFSTSLAVVPSYVPRGLVSAAIQYLDRGFWDGICCDGYVPLRLDDQMELLRPIVTRAGCIALVNRHALAGSECDFTKRLLRTSLDRPVEFPQLERFDVHVVEQQTAEDRERSKGYWKTQFSRIAGGRCATRVFFWPDDKLLARILLAGSIDESNRDTKTPGFKWGLSMDHVALMDDRREGPAHWKLLSKRERWKERHRLYEGEKQIDDWQF